MQAELKVRELERFKACYCGLCRALGKGYGLASRFILSYDLVFLAMLLWGDDEKPVIKQARCIASPLRKKRYCVCSSSLETCAAYSVILTWWKLKDTISDEPFFRALPHRMLAIALYRAYNKAARLHPVFSRRVEEELAALADYEAEGSRSMDGAADGASTTEGERSTDGTRSMDGAAESGRFSESRHATEGRRSMDGAADKFAMILKSITPADAPNAIHRPFEELLYHLGRWIYISDAFDDYYDDVEHGRYNAVAARYAADAAQSGASISDDILKRMETTLTHSNNLVCLAYELLPENTWADIIRNVIYLGMPATCDQIIKKHTPQRA